MQKTCANTWCKRAFDVTQEDIDFLQRVAPVLAGRTLAVPPPLLCPSCREIRRYAWRNEWSLHRRACSRTGREMVSMYRPDVPFPVYDNAFWWSDDWDAKEYGVDVDFSRSFLAQFLTLARAVPKMARIQQGENVNAQYTNCASYNRNCYLLFSSNHNEDCEYGTHVHFCKSCIDGYHVHRCELCAHCINCTDCYALIGGRDCVNCASSWFLKSCSGCRNCIGCVNLHQKQYCVFNEQLTQAAYEEQERSLQRGGYSMYEDLRKRWEQFIVGFPCRSYEGVQNQRVTGNYVSRSKNALQCYDCEDLEDCSHCCRCLNLKDCRDISNYGGVGMNELCYECEGIGHGVVRVSFSKLIWGGSSDVLYSFECFASHHLFGCAGLKRAEYCILNKQYSEQEYNRLIPKIIERMKADNEWGEFFPAQESPIGYNETIAQDYYPLSKKDALARGFRWREREEEVPQVQKIIPADRLPDGINEIPDDVLQWAIQCKATQRPFLINKRELDSYRRMHLPLPRFHPDERHRCRMALLNPHKLWSRTCAKCEKGIETTYAPDRPEKVYCEQCYLKEVY
ncbi:MAG: hypothetical protein PHO92_03955 [Candidatus Peribacteraceae bacterium]|nr:hypothetical protein [Candidatus Peribacteraceae bacterium]